MYQTFLSYFSENNTIQHVKTVWFAPKTNRVGAAGA